MIFLMILIVTKATYGTNAGSSIFYKQNSENYCWSENDIARLRARQIFEEIIPPAVLPYKLDDKYIKNILKYFRNALQTASTDEDGNKMTSTKDVLMDTIGSHMRSEILPSARYGYYAGYVRYRHVRELHDFYNSLKIMLNTQGLGWKRPDKLRQLRNLTVDKIRIGSTIDLDPCSHLIIKRDSRSCIHIPSPKYDDELKPSALALPFKVGGFVNLESSKSENVLLKYYTTVSRCILKKSPRTCRHSDFVNFNNELWHWMKRNVAPHLVDENLYAAYGGIFRVAAAVQNYGKGLSRRNIFTYRDGGISKWHPWKLLKETYVYVDTDSIAHTYIFVVMIIAAVIYLLLICYNCIQGDDDECCCLNRKDPSITDVEYAYVDSNIPAMLPSPRSDKSATAPKTKSSFDSVRTEKVYDMNENKDKMMAVIASDDESDKESTNLSETSSVINEKKTGQSDTERPSSPPKLETTITEMSVDKKQIRMEKVLSLYSTTTVTDSERTYRAGRESWSGTGSSSSGRSASTSTPKRRSHRSRDLAWAQRIATKHARRLKSTSGTT